MSDVRLTATNPEDSSVVPVACNAKGELKLEEPIAPPEFDGNLDGDLTVSGSASFAGAVQSGGNPIGGAETGSMLRPYTFNVSNADFGGNPTGIFTGYETGDSVANILIQNNGSIFINPDSLDGIGFPVGSKIRLNASGSASFAGQVNVAPDTGNGLLAFSVGKNNAISMTSNGTANFGGDVVIGSRSKQWMLVEQGGLCHMVEQVRATTADLVDPAAEYPKLRDVFKELNTIERCLEEVMTKLRMTEPDGWPVWDGSDNSQ